MKTEKLFYNAEATCKKIGVSVRHFRRLSEDAGIWPVEINRKFFWRPEHLLAINAYRNALAVVRQSKGGR